MSATKSLAIIVRVKVDHSIKDFFYDLISVPKCDATSLHAMVVNTFTENNIPYLDNLIGVAADGANVMTGCNHSVAALLKKDIPNLFIIKCICHSFNLSASEACAKLPNEPECLCREIYNYFKSSFSRISDFIEFQTLFEEIPENRILRIVDTRWLSFELVVKRLVQQYPALKVFFIDGAMDKNAVAAEKCNEILTIMNDESTILYLMFLEFTLPIFNNLNKLMQSEHPQIYKMKSNVEKTCRTFMDLYMREEYLIVDFSRIQYKNPRCFKELETMYLGAKVEKRLLDQNIDPIVIQQFRLKCLDFLIQAVASIFKRFDCNNPVFQNLEFFDPAVVMSRKNESIVALAKFFSNLVRDEDLQALDTEWRLLRNDEVLQVIDKDITVESFWNKIKNLKQDGVQVYPRLYTVMGSLLALPHSSAACERIFSHLSIIKTKQRNRLQAETTCGLLHTKSLIGNNECYNFPIEKRLVNMVKDLKY